MTVFLLKPKLRLFSGCRRRAKTLNPPRCLSQKGITMAPHITYFKMQAKPGERQIVIDHFNLWLRIAARTLVASSASSSAPTSAIPTSSWPTPCSPTRKHMTLARMTQRRAHGMRSSGHISSPTQSGSMELASSSEWARSKPQPTNDPEAPRRPCTARRRVAWRGRCAGSRQCSAFRRPPRAWPSVGAICHAASPTRLGVPRPRVG